MVMGGGGGKPEAAEAAVASASVADGVGPQPALHVIVLVSFIFSLFANFGFYIFITHETPKNHHP